MLLRPYEGQKPTAPKGHGSHRRRAQGKHKHQDSRYSNYSDLSPAVSGKGLKQQPLAVESEAYPLRAARHPTAQATAVKCLTSDARSSPRTAQTDEGCTCVNIVVDSVAELTLYVYHHGSETQGGKATEQKPAQLDFIAPVPRHQAHKAVR